MPVEESIKIFNSSHIFVQTHKFLKIIFNENLKEFKNKYIH